MPASSSVVLRLTAFLAAVGLATSRLGLVAPEFVGHGGATLAVGGHVTEVQLFWFAGGWIRYAIPATTANHLIVALGGVAIEIAIGLPLWLAVRGDGLGARIVRALGATLIVHASWYLATGAWHGYGDGTLLYRELGDARYPFAIGVALVGCAFAWLGARHVVGALLAAVDHRVAALVVALVAAAAINIGLDLGELRVRRDATYAATMAPERERVVAREMAAWLAAHPAEVSEAERAAKAAQLEEAHRTFPFAWLFGGALLVAIAAGARATRRRAAAPLTARAQRLAVALAAGAIALVIAIDYAVGA